jgi:hypothetical protein
MSHTSSAAPSRKSGIILAAFISSLLLGSFLPAMSSAHDVGQGSPHPSCNGLLATHWVSGGRLYTNNGGGANAAHVDLGAYFGTLTGTANDDVIVGSSNGDTIDAGTGNDTVCAGGGGDTVTGGDGTDTLFGENGADTLNGGNGNDRLEGGNDGDTLNGNDGDDLIIGGNDGDALNGGNGEDILRGEQGNDSHVGGNGVDNCFGAQGNNSYSTCENDGSADGGVIVIEKDAVPDDQQSFAFTGLGGFSLQNDGNENVDPSELAFSRAAGSYVVTETSLGGWTLNAVVCNDAGTTVNLAQRSATIDLDAGEVIRCIFTNAKQVASSSVASSVISSSTASSELSSSTQSSSTVSSSVSSSETSSSASSSDSSASSVSSDSSVSSASSSMSCPAISLPTPPLNCQYVMDDINNDGCLEPVGLSCGASSASSSDSSDSSTSSAASVSSGSSTSSAASSTSSSNGSTSSTSSASSSISPTACVASDLIAHWTFDDNGGTAATDSAGGHHGVVNGAEWTTSGAPISPNTSALAFDGLLDEVTAPGAAFALGTSDFTVSTFLKTTTGNRSVLGHYHVTSGGFRGWGLYVYGTNRVNFFGYGDLGVNDASQAATVLDNQWHHVVGVYKRSGSQLTIDTYVDGILAGTNVSTVGNIGLTTDMLIGKYNFQAHFAGSLDDVRVYDRALTPAEISSLMTSCGGSSSSTSSSASSAGSSVTASVASAPSSAQASAQGGGQGGGSTQLSGLTVTTDSNSGNGARRGDQTNVLFGALKRLADFNVLRSDVPGAAFGGTARVPLSDKELNYLCSMQFALPENAPEEMELVVAERMATLMNRPLDFVLQKLDDRKSCLGILSSRLPKPKDSAAKSTGFPVAADGFPVSTNDTWNACIRNDVTLSDLRSNSDRDNDGLARDCSSYHTKDIWRQPDLGIYFGFDRQTKTVTLPEGYFVENVNVVLK